MLFAFASADITIMPVVTNHSFDLEALDRLLAFVGNMGAHGGEPFQCIKGCLLFTVLGFVNDL